MSIKKSIILGIERRLEDLENLFFVWRCWVLLRFFFFLVFDVVLEKGFYRECFWVCIIGDIFGLFLFWVWGGCGFVGGLCILGFCLELKEVCILVFLGCFL